ncbi:MAG: cytochrome c3 family protein [Thermodesulfobacteriota bacterium]
MDKKTLFLMLGEAVLIVILVVVVAMDYKSKPAEETLVAHTTKMEEEDVSEKEAVAEEKAAKAEELTAETPEEVVEEKGEKDEAVAQKEAPAEAEKPVEEKAAAKAEKPAEEKAEAPAEEKAEAPPEEKAEAPPAAAGSGEVADVIPMDNPAYSEHTKPIAQFTHKKHYEEYKISCGECHHDENAEPLTDLKPGDPVEDCIACHDKPGKAPRGEKLSKEEELQYHTEALHENCIGCHREYNRENNTKDAPQTCGKCHVKEG